jgi:hypothetical protein
VVGVQQQSPAEWAPAVLAAQQVPGGRVHRQPGAAPPLVPVSGEGGIVAWPWPVAASQHLSETKSAAERYGR